MEMQMEKEFRELKAKVDDIHRLLLGSEHEEDVGILYRIRKNEADIQNFKDWKARITYFAYGMVVPASYGVFDVVKSILQAIGK
ncbi:MAG TPA: hypothetical protein PLS10_10660 [Chitinophagales bacterium]|nr:hypothetical protein [Chitinophagales bacterium]